MAKPDSEGENPTPFGIDVSPKILQPRIVFALLLVGSGAGVWLSRRGNPFLALGSWWLLLLSLGSLCGGLYWRLVLFDATNYEDGDLGREISKRWRRVEGFLVVCLLLGGIGGLSTGAVGRPLDAGNVTIGIGVILSPLLWVVLGRYPWNERSQTATALRWLFFVVVLGSLTGFAWVEAVGGPLAWIVRTGHIGSFALWIGGASWHNFVVLPTMHVRPNASDQIKAGARRFRRHLPFVIAVLLATGSYQAVRLLGYSISALVETPIGRLVAVKFVVLVVLTGLVFANFRRARAADGPVG